MARFVRLVKFTPEGLRHVKELPELFARGRQYLESLGGRFVDVYAVSGPYDLVAVIEAPDGQAVMKHGLFVAQTGYVEIATMPATPIQEFLKTVAEVPKP
ncbi:MAG: GYD domain-containing protein [Deltaproteobacteria bacterium]|nr:GYD domain-containing protein [Deltaproteobacteria bacterium]